MTGFFPVDRKGDSMKKSLALLCVLAMLFSQLALGGIVSSAADRAGKCIEVDPAVISGNGGNEGLQNYFVADTSPFALGNNKAFTFTTNNNEIYNYWYDEVTATASYAGVLMWVDGTNGSFGVNPMIVTDGNSPLHIGENQTYYLLCNGVWESATATYCKASVPSGFKGWLYIPFGAYFGGMPTGKISYCRVYLNSVGDAAGKTVSASIPYYVRMDGVDENGKPKFAKVALTGKEPPENQESGFTPEHFKPEEPGEEKYAVLSDPIHVEGSGHPDRCPALGTVTVGEEQVAGFTALTQGSASGHEMDGDCYPVEEIKVKQYAGLKFRIDGGDTGFRFNIAIDVDGVGISYRKYIPVYCAVYYLPDGAADWKIETTRYFGLQIPANFNGWVFIPFSTFDATSGSVKAIEIWNPSVRLGDIPDSETPYRPDKETKGGTEVKFTVPLWVPSNMVNGEGKPTDEPYDPNAPAPPPAPELPEYTGEKVDYGDVDMAAVKVPMPFTELQIGKPISSQWNDVHDVSMIPSTKLVQNKLPIQQIPLFSSNRATTNEGGLDECIGSYYVKQDSDTVLSPIDSDGGKAFMFYIEVPDIGEEVPVRINGAFVKDNRWLNMAVYNGTVEIMSVSDYSWTTMQLSAYYFYLPSGFKGMVRMPYERFGTADAENATSGEYKLASVNYYVANMPGGKEYVYISAPMVVTNLGNTGRAIYLNGDTTVARDMFTGEPMSAEKVGKMRTVGDFVYELSEPTLKGKVTHGSITSSIVPKWETIENASRYQVELYIRGTKAHVPGYLLCNIVNVYDKDRVALDGLMPVTDYVIVVRAFDEVGAELGVLQHDAFSTTLMGMDDDFGDIDFMGTESNDPGYGYGFDDDYDPEYETFPDTGKNDGVLIVFATFLVAGLILITMKQKLHRDRA